MAEEAGFEPARACDPCRFSKPVPSTTWVFLRARIIISTGLVFVIIFLYLKAEKVSDSIFTGAKMKIYLKEIFIKIGISGMRL